MINARELARIAKDAMDAWVQLEVAANEKPSIILARKMKPAFKSESPTLDSDWSLNLQDQLLNERPDERVPGGLLSMTHDALSVTDHAGKSICNYAGVTLGSHCCALIIKHAEDVTARHPAVPELCELLEQQTRYIDKQLSRRFPPPAVGQPATEWVSAKGIIRTMAVKGHTVTRQELHNWARGKHISKTQLADGHSGFKLDEVLAHIERQKQ